MNYVLAWIRIVLVVLCIFIFLIYYFITILILGRNLQRGFKIRQACIYVICWILGYRIKTYGHMDQVTPAIYISNHRCFSDPILALRFFHFLPIGKSEIAQYPLIGIAAKETGILFVNRQRRDSRHEVKLAMSENLKNGYNIFLCPEGTTNVGQLTKEFKKGAFEVAVENAVPMIPLAMVYHEPSQDFWIPGDSLIQHFIRQFGKWETRVDIYFPTEPFTDSDPIRLMNATKEWIDDKLQKVEVPKEISELAIYNLKV